MNLLELRNYISLRTAGDFHTVATGPLFNSSFSVIFEGGSKDGRITDVATHDTRLVCIDDIDIAIEWGFPANDRDEEHHPWAQDANFPDPSVRTYLVDIFYRGSLVDREFVCSVDGGRAYLPAPAPRRVLGGPYKEGEPIAWRVSEWELAIARIVDGDRPEFDSYLERAGIFVVPA